MPKIIIPQKELPIPLTDHLNKFQFRIVNENRNIYSDWSVINFINQKDLLSNDTETLPPPGNPGDVLVVLPEPADGWESGWTPIASVLPPNVVTSESNHDVPPGGLEGQVLTKLSDEDYDVAWDDQIGGGGGGAAAVSPQDGNLVIGIMILT